MAVTSRVLTHHGKMKAIATFVVNYFTDNMTAVEALDRIQDTLDGKTLLVEEEGEKEYKSDNTTKTSPDVH